MIFNAMTSRNLGWFHKTKQKKKVPNYFTSRNSRREGYLFAHVLRMRQEMAWAENASHCPWSVTGSFEQQRTENKTERIWKRTKPNGKKRNLACNLKFLYHIYSKQSPFPPPPNRLIPASLHLPYQGYCLHKIILCDPI